MRDDSLVGRSALISIAMCCASAIAAQETTPPGDLEPLGPLTAEQKAMVSRKLAGGRDAWRKRYLRQVEAGATATDPLDSYERELAALKGAIRYEVAARMLADDSYQAYPASTGNASRAKDRIPAGWESIVSHNAAVDSQGCGIDLVYAMDPRRHSDLAAVIEQLAAVRRLRADSELQRFNALPLEERRARIERHDRALEAIGSEETRALPDEERFERVRELTGRLLRVSSRIDRSSWTLSR